MKKRAVLISIDQDLYTWYKAQHICLSKEVQLLLAYQRENQLKKTTENI